ncbi:MAG: DUF1800 domain-containing protein [Cyanobacteria bacterium P01_A01_bin.114]
MNSARTTHVLNRLSFGPRPGDRQQVERTGVDAYIQAQLDPANLPEPTALSARLEEFSNLKLSAVELFERHTAPKTESSEARKNARLQRVHVLQEAEQARLLRALDSPRQLQEVMVDFWFNHFNVFAGKGLTMLWTGAYEQTAIRPHALGKFRDLLGATAKHPAMSFYLDNWRNTDPNSPGAQGRFKGLNENYARELMELHTLGVDGGYTQADVENLARILTGWSLVRHQQPSSDENGPDESGFVFARARHAPGDKVLLGETIPGGGIDEGETALDLLAQHSATARHIGYKLAQYFVADTPPEGLINQLADRFSATDGDIRAVLEALFESDEFWQQAHYQRKFKTPYQYLLSMARAVGLTDLSEERLKRLKGAMNHLGMPLYRCRTPDGYAQVEAAWLSPDAMVRRVSFAIATVNQHKAAKPEAEALLETLGEQFSAETLAAIEEAPRSLRPALILGSPEMMYR